MRTNDQGNNWEEISPDLTKGVPNRMMKLMNRNWSIDELASKSSMAQLSAVEESPIDENILFAGSGDGVISYTVDGGKTWKKSANPPGLPEYSRISHIAASNHNRLIAYVAAENFNGETINPSYIKLRMGVEHGAHLIITFR